MIDDLFLRMRRRASVEAFLLGLAASSCGESAMFRATTVPANTFDTAGPYTVTTVLRSGSLERVDLLFCVGPACSMAASGGSGGGATLPFRALPMERVSEGRGESVWRGLIPGQPGGTDVSFYLRATGAGTVTDPREAEARAGAGQRYYTFSIKRPSGPCRVDADCGRGELCDESKACRAVLAACSSDDDCLAGFRCEGRCVIRERRCAAHVDCLLGERCDRASRICRPRVECGSDGAGAAATACPTGSACDGAARICRISCASSTECDSSEECVVGRCAPRAACKSSAGCPAGLACEMPGGACRAQGARYCQVCASDADCGDANDYCILPPGAITGACAVACTKGPCPAGSRCRADFDPPQCVPEASC